MKFLCVQCDEGMRFEEAIGPEEGSVTIVFRCPTCSGRVALLTNPLETQLVQALDVKIGGRTVAPAPLESLREGLVGGVPLWTKEAEARLRKVPAPMRPIVRNLAEKYATETGRREITAEVLDQARHRFGK